MVSQYTSKVKDEQIFRQTLWKAMKTVKQEQTALVSSFYFARGILLCGGVESGSQFLFQNIVLVEI